MLQELLGVTEVVLLHHEDLPQLGERVVVVAHLDETIPQEVVLVPRSMGLPAHDPTPVTIEVAQRTVA